MFFRPYKQPLISIVFNLWKSTCKDVKVISEHQACCYFWQSCMIVVWYFQIHPCFSMELTCNSDIVTLTTIKITTPSLCKLILTLYWNEWEPMAAEGLEQHDQKTVYNHVYGSVSECNAKQINLSHVYIFLDSDEKQTAAHHSRCDSSWGVYRLTGHEGCHAQQTRSFLCKNRPAERDRAVFCTK